MMNGYQSWEADSSISLGDLNHTYCLSTLFIENFSIF